MKLQLHRLREVEKYRRSTRHHFNFIGGRSTAKLCYSWKNMTLGGEGGGGGGGQGHDANFSTNCEPSLASSLASQTLRVKVWWHTTTHNINDQSPSCTERFIKQHTASPSFSQGLSKCCEQNARDNTCSIQM
jgi:hypothetical protein